MVSTIQKHHTNISCCRPVCEYFKIIIFAYAMSYISSLYYWDYLCAHSCLLLEAMLHLFYEVNSCSSLMYTQSNQLGSLDT